MINTKFRCFRPVWISLVLSILLMVSCGGQKEHQWSGATMGTTYRIKVIASRSADMAPVQARIDELLVRINQSMSTYQSDSEISRFNALTAAGEPFPITADFLRVMLSAREIHQLTRGAWDGTVDPLVNLWGFGKAGPLRQLPSAEAIENARQQVGFDLIDVSVTGQLKKKTGRVTVDLGSIAKGYGVDQVAILLNGLGFEHYLVEIGGEVYAAGRRIDGKPWRVGINKPSREAPSEAVYKVVELKDSAMATSGDYRNFVEIEGRTFSHIIDPRTGYPVQNNVVSASVLADNCTLADGLATALVVMGPEKGIALLDLLQGVEGMIIVRRSDGELVNFWSRGLQNHD